MHTRVTVHPVVTPRGRHSPPVFQARRLKHSEVCELCHVLGRECRAGFARRGPPCAESTPDWAPASGLQVTEQVPGIKLRGDGALWEGRDQAARPVEGGVATGSGEVSAEKGLCGCPQKGPPQMRWPAAAPCSGTSLPLSPKGSDY